MDSLQAIHVIQGIITFLFCALHSSVTIYLSIHPKRNYDCKITRVVMFIFLSLSCLLLAANSFLLVFEQEDSLAESILGNMSISAAVCANLQVLFFWINFMNQFYSKMNRQRLINVLQIGSLVVVNVGHFIFAMISFYTPSSDVMMGYRITMITLIVFLEIVLIILGTLLWYKLHSETEKDFYKFAKKIAQVMITVGSVGLLWVGRYLFAMNVKGYEGEFANAVISLTISVLLWSIFLRFFARKALLGMLGIFFGKTKTVPHLSPRFSSTTAATSSPSSMSPKSPRRSVEDRSAALDIPLGILVGVEGLGQVRLDIMDDRNCEEVETTATLGA